MALSGEITRSMSMSEWVFILIMTTGTVGEPYEFELERFNSESACLQVAALAKPEYRRHKITTMCIHDPLPNPPEE